MSIMGQVGVQSLQWFAVRTKSINPGRRTCVLGAEFETYRNAQGRVCKRRKPNTGKRIYVPEHLARRAGFEVFLPVRKVWQSTDRFSKKKELVTYPLLAGWMFVGWSAFESRWHELMSLGVVVGVMGTGGRPIRISEADMFRLMRRWGGGVLSPEFQRYMRRGKEFDLGDSVQVVAGALAGQEVRVVDISGPSARVVVDLLGSKTEVQVRVDYLEGTGG
jgi:transcription termination/antitermination protein NusG